MRYFEIARAISHRAFSHRAFRSIVVGGVSYSVGAVLNLLHWPVSLPGILGAHEVFHFFVLAGSLAHYWFILKIVVPFVPAS